MPVFQVESGATRRALLKAAGAGALMAGALPAWGAETGYAWSSVKVGGGGFVPGVVFSRVQHGLAYLRSDMGGAYRWDAAAGRWTPLLDGMAASTLQGVESVAPDPVDADVVYLACGMYGREAAAMLRSADRGANWTVTPVPFRMGGNEPGRGVGERLAVDPNLTSILYFGSRHDGLQRSADHGVTWAQAAGFSFKGQAKPPGWKSNAGVSFVVFDPASGVRGQASRTLFVGIADPTQHHLWRSDDAGESWRPIGPDMDLLPCKAELDALGQLYITYCNGIGPNGVTDGAVCRYEVRSEAWADITPEKPTPEHPGGFMGISVDRSRPGTLAVASLNRWKPYDTVWRSTDQGRTWASIHDGARRDVSASPFLLWGEPQADIGWWMAGLAIDPFDSDFACYTTGATIYATHDFTKVGAGQPTLWTPWVDGIEQTAVLTLVCPPAGPPLLSGFGDIAGFTHEDLAVSPRLQFTHPVFANTDQIDYAAHDPRIVVRSGTHHPRHDGPILAWSDDFAHSWTPLDVPGLPDTASAPIVVSADGATFMVMAPTPVISRDRGRTWTPVTGLPVGARPVPDRVEAARFTALDFATGRRFVSRDGGASFTEQPVSGLPANLAADGHVGPEQAAPLRAVPGRRGSLWLVSHQGLFRSDDGGRAFRKVDADIAVEVMDFGKPPPGQAFPALYALGSRGDLRAIWRSDDEGVNWMRINDDRHEYGRRFRCIAADQRVFGRVFVGADGRGILMGQIA